MLTYIVKRMHQDDRNKAYSLLAFDSCGLMAMGDNHDNVYFFTRRGLSNNVKKELCDKGIVLYMEESKSQDTKLE